jgi:hypothetical protein
MKATARLLIVVAMAAIMVAGSAFAQGIIKKTWVLTFNLNVPGADIYVDNVVISGTTATVVAAKHNIRVHADGYHDFSQVIDVAGNLTIPVALRPIVFPLTVKPNVQNASVFLDGVEITGTTSTVNWGIHTLQVIAEGYREYKVQLNVTSPQVLNVALEPLGFMLTVNANVPEAELLVNNVAKGPIPYSELLPGGRYSLRVTAPGFNDFLANVALDKAMTVNAQLQPEAPTLTLVIPPAFMDPELRPNDPLPPVRIYVDNRLVNPKNELDRVPVAQGKHKVRIVSGIFSFQLGEITFQPGFSYIIEASLDMKVRAVRPTK